MLRLRIVVFTASLLASSTAVWSQRSPQGPSSSQPVATLGQIFMGPLGGNSSAFTGILITNRDPNQASCTVGIFFHQGASVGQQVPEINGQPGESAVTTIPRGGVRKFDFTADELIQGSVSIFVDPPCDSNSISVQGTYFIGNFDQPRGLSESFTITPNDSSKWLRSGRCLAISTNLGTTSTGMIRQNLGIATSSVSPGQPALAGTFLSIMLFDDQGNFVSESSRDVTGEHDPFFPGDAFPGSSGCFTLIFCLNSEDPTYNLDVSAVRVNQRGPEFEFDSSIFTDGFESGDLSAWSR